MQHSHILGGSIATQRRNCSGSYYYEQKSPKQPASEFADRGSMLHAAIQLILINQPKTMRRAEPLLLETIGQNFDFEDQEVTQELVDTKLRPAMKAWFEISKKWKFTDWSIEQRVSLEAVIPGAFGTADILAKDKQNRLHVLDWKFGDGVAVDAEANDSEAFYAAAALYDEDEEIALFCENITGIVFHIVQPRRGSEKVYSSWETDEAWIDKWLDQTVQSMKQALLPDPPTKPGSWCKWCRAKPICPAYDTMASEALSKTPKTLDATELAHALKQARLLKAWITEVFQLAQRELEGGAALPGYKLVNKLPRRQWIDVKNAQKRLRAARLLVGQMYHKTLISPAQLEKVKPNLYRRMANEYVTMKSSGLTVVEDTDSRPAVSGSVELLANALPQRPNESETAIRTGIDQ